MNVEFCLCLPQHAWYLASDDVSFLGSAVKSSSTGTIQAYSSNGPRTQERNKLVYADAKGCPVDDTEDPRGGKAETDPAVTLPAEIDTCAVFASLGVKKLFKQNV